MPLLAPRLPSPISSCELLYVEFSRAVPWPSRPVRSIGARRPTKGYGRPQKPARLAHSPFTFRGTSSNQPSDFYLPCRYHQIVGIFHA